MLRINRKISLITGLLILFVILSVNIISGIIGFESIREKIEKRISEMIGGEVTYQDARLAIFPIPHIIFSEVGVSIPGYIRLEVDSIKIYPEILPVLKGNIRPYRVSLIKPDLHVVISLEKDGNRDEKEVAYGYPDLRPKFEMLRDLMASYHLDLEVIVEKGFLSLPAESNVFFKFNHINAKTRLSSDRFDIDASCSSNIWNKIEFRSVFNLITMNGSGKVDFFDLEPQKILVDFLHIENVQTDDTRINLNIDFIIRNLTDLYATIKSSLPSIILKQDNRKIEINSKYLDGYLKIDNGTIKVVLNSLELDYPKLSLSGKLFIDPFSPEISFEIKGKNVDVASTRHTALLLFGQNRIAQLIFEILQNGAVPEITVSSSAKSLKTLGRLSNLKIKGILSDGDIHVPKVDLDLSKVSGEVFISEGILYGKNLEGWLDNSKGCDGSLKLGLFKGENIPFHLDVGITADLSELSPVLRRLVKYGKLKREIENISMLQGKATGRLILGEYLHSIMPTINVTSLYVMEAFYNRVPFPMHVSHGRVFYDGTHINVLGIQGRVGNSFFSDLSFSVDWEDEKLLHVISKSADVNMEELYPWLVSFHPIYNVCHRLKYLKGNFCFQALEMNGPIFKPQQWEFDISGTPLHLSTDADFLGGPVMVSQGMVEVDQYDIIFEDVMLNSLESKVNANGSVYDYLKGVESFSTDFTGHLGEDNFLWLAGISNIPEILRPKGPFDILKGRMVWQRHGPFSLFADVDIQAGTNVKIDLMAKKNALSIKTLSVKDMESDAIFSYDSCDDEVGVSFSGKLTGGTLDTVLENNPFLDGDIYGDFYGDFYGDMAQKSYTRGNVKGSRLKIPLPGFSSVTLNQFSIAAEENGICLENVDVNYQESQAMVQGTLNFSEEGFIADFNLASGFLDLKKITELFNTESKNPDRNEKENPSWPVSGRIDIKGEEVVYGNRTFTDLHSLVLFKKDEITASIIDAELCGIAVKGTIEAFPERVSFNIIPYVSDGNLNKTLNCLSEKKVQLDGEFNLNGEIEGMGGGKEGPDITHGRLEFKSVNGRIYNFVILAKTLSILNVADMLRGDFPDLRNEGFPYRSIKIKGYFESGKFILEEAVIDNSSMGITAKGEIALKDMTLNLTILVAPLKTVDLVIRHIPIVNEILDGTLVSIPVKVTGSYSSPKTVFLEPSAVESELVGIMERTLKLPFTIIKPIFSDDKKADE
ncbi:MAG: AsmA-like C-terminal region-containing protein [Proteobacteria bacterium]|nr:AsmA-like C-terminal region-containing protein [Pseudomonadota bacterium]